MTNDRINEIATKYWDEEIDYDRGESYTSIDNIEDAIREALAEQKASDREKFPYKINPWMPIPEPPKE